MSLFAYMRYLCSTLFHREHLWAQILVPDWRNNYLATRLETFHITRPNMNHSWGTFALALPPVYYVSNASHSWVRIAFLINTNEYLLYIQLQEAACKYPTVMLWPCQSIALPYESCLLSSTQSAQCSQPHKHLETLGSATCMHGL